MINRTRIGVTNDLTRRVWQHKNDIRDALVRETEIKASVRCKNITLVEVKTPKWTDLSKNLFEQ